MNGWYELNDGLILNLDKITTLNKDVKEGIYAVLDSGDSVVLSTYDYYEIRNILLGIEK